ncbi:MAG: hypothetical protein ACJA19_001481 [Bacteroidia bacterium]|jgi:hypothetical protein|tara:strand:+ start:3131 stop:3253 length:123 start_codon:yes stop_codon:yes gene_type:complete
MAVRLRNDTDTKDQAMDVTARMVKKGLDSFKTEEIFGRRN